MDLKLIHDIIDIYLRKEQGGFITHPEKDTVINRCQYELFEEIKPAYGANQQTHDYLLPFKKTTTFTNANTPGGVITLPTDYYHLSAVSLSFVDANNRTRFTGLEMVNDDELDTRRDSALTPISINYPIGVYDQNKTIQVYPAAPCAGTIKYLRKPLDCLYAFTGTGRNAVYNSAGSVQLEWNEPAINKIINKVLQYLGLNVQDMNTQQFAIAKEGEGGK